MILRKNKRTARIGIFAVAHATYWDQFEGLLDNIMGYHKDLCELVEKNDVEIVDVKFSSAEGLSNGRSFSSYAALVLYKER